MKPKISVITATYNAASTIRALYESIARQQYDSFEWVISDGVSTDGTLALLQSFATVCPWIRLVSEPDFGIYHALNKAISRALGDYYLVVGADDILEIHSLENYARCMGAADVVFARVIRAGRIIGGLNPTRAWIGPSRVFQGSHSVGTLIRRDLHDTFGLYSNRFPLLADIYFLKLLLRSGHVKFVEREFIAGTFNEGGATTGNQLQLLAENWQIQMLTEPSRLLQTFLFFNKVLVRYGVISSEMRAKAR